MSDTMRPFVVESGDYSSESRPHFHRLQNSRELFDVYRLAYQCNYKHNRFQYTHDGLSITHPDFDHIPETAIWVAELEGEIVGSVTTTLNGSRGLPLDTDYLKSSRLMDIKDQSLALVWRLAIQEHCPLREVMIDTLMTAALKELQSFGAQTILFQVHNEYVDYCRKRLNAVALMRVKSEGGAGQGFCVILRGEIANLKMEIEKSKDMVRG